MISIQPSENIKKYWQALAIGSLATRIRVYESPEALQKELRDQEHFIRQNYKLEQVSSIPQIHAGREAYKAFGKKPARYRLSSEALMRRILKDQGLTLVNNIVEINNLLSLKSGYPICAFDLDKIQPPLTFTLGSSQDVYHAIGRGIMNIENLPVFKDQKGAFGSPTSDSERVKITTQTQNLSMNIISFNGPQELEAHLQELARKLEQYADARDTETRIFQQAMS
jgi:DNA/RNA-binding domain of Phe-tRNA-synthetase-like protein